MWQQGQKNQFLAKVNGICISIKSEKVRSVRPHIQPVSGFMSVVFDQVLTVNSIVLCCDHTLNASLHLPTQYFFFHANDALIHVCMEIMCTFIKEKCQSMCKFYTRKGHNKYNDRDALQYDLV